MLYTFLKKTATFGAHFILMMHIAESIENPCETPWISLEQLEEEKNPPLPVDIKTSQWEKSTGYTPIKVSIEMPENINDQKPYRLHIGDTLLVSVYGSDELRTPAPVIVNPTGSIVLPTIGRVQALGKTMDEFRQSLNEKIQKEYPDTLSSVTAVSLIGNRYTILGELATPGTHTTTGNTTVLSAIAEAGGFPLRGLRFQTFDYADLDKAFLIRDGEYIPVDFKALVYEGDLAQNIVLQGGDYIYIPTKNINHIYVLGTAANALVFDFLERTSLMEIVAAVGGLRPDTSSRILVLRGSLNIPEVFMIDINLITQGCEPDFPLQPGDIVYFPTQRFTNAREIIRLAVLNFVNSLASVAGNEAYVELNPRARGATLPVNTFVPIPIIPITSPTP